MFSRAARARILPFVTYLLFIALADLLARAGASAEQLRWLYPLKVGAVAALLVVFWPQYRELRIAAPSPRWLAAACVAGLLVLFLWVNLSWGWMVLGHSDGYDPRADGRMLWPLVAVRVAGAALVVPVMEELFWRSFLPRWLEDVNFDALPVSQVRLKNLLLPAILFGFEHNLWLAGIVAGVVYSALYVRSGNLWSAILAHAVTNGGLGVWIVLTGSWTYW